MATGKVDIGVIVEFVGSVNGWQENIMEKNKPLKDLEPMPDTPFGRWKFSVDDLNKFVERFEQIKKNDKEKFENDQTI